MTSTSQPRGLPMHWVTLFYAAMVGAALLWEHLDSDAAWQLIPTDDGTLLIHVATGVLVGAFVIGASELTLRWSAAMRRLVDDLAAMLGKPGHLQIALLALLSGSSEEILFRGAIQATWGLAAAALIFGLLHGLPGTRFACWGIFALAVGLVLGVLQERSSAVLSAICAHVTVNWVNLYRITRRRAGPWR